MTLRVHIQEIAHEGQRDVLGFLDDLDFAGMGLRCRVVGLCRRCGGGCGLGGGWFGGGAGVAVDELPQPGGLDQLIDQWALLKPLAVVG